MPYVSQSEGPNSVPGQAAKELGEALHTATVPSSKADLLLPDLPQKVEQKFKPLRRSHYLVFGDLEWGIGC